MSDLAEKQVRHAFFGLLSTLSTVNKSGMTRFFPITLDEVPFLSVFTGDEEIEYSVMGQEPVKEHTLEVKVEVIVAQEANAEDLLSEVISQILTTIENDKTLKSLVLDVSHVLTQRNINDSGSVKTIFGTVFFSVTYRTRDGSPDLILEA